MQKSIKVALLCGGPSLERGISLNSARSILDHLSSEKVHIIPFYLDQKKRPYRISPAQLYSNTPSDFDFKLNTTAKPLSEKQFVRALKEAGIAFPAMHGAYGEDGGIQSFLEKHGVPFVGSSATSCKKGFDKSTASEYIKNHGFHTLPSIALKIYGTDHKQKINEFFKTHKIKRAAVKPASGGSSIGVFSVGTPEEALAKVQYLFGKRMDTRVVIEEFASGFEFTTILLENRFGIPVALPPTEIEADYTKHQIFSFRKKYLPTRQVIWHCPPRFDDAVVERIQAQAEQLFSLFKMRDFARFDGWVLPDGKLWFCDFNTVSGMEQNSFLFQQGARVGLTHADLLRYILENACRRYGISMPPPSRKKSSVRRKPVSVLFGGSTSERQVSLMSGTNVWLKLRASDQYEPHPYLLGMDGKTVWHLPYYLALNHTVEEIAENCRAYGAAKKRFGMFEERARLHLGFSEPKDLNEFFDPEQETLTDVLKKTNFLFNALHGGSGEDGTLQRMLEKQNVPFNGPGSDVSRLAIDKWETAERIRALHIEGVDAIAGIVVPTKKLLDMTKKELDVCWNETCKKLGAHTLIIKPSSDGCSTGVVHLYSSSDLGTYVEVVRRGEMHAAQGMFKNQREIIEMPSEKPTDLILERFIETDILRVKNNQLKHRRKSGFVEITIGVIEKNDRLYALYPSITIAEGEVLTVEEKFQGGTGVNLTPPPSSVLGERTVHTIRERIERLGEKIGIRGYSRIDAFVHTKTGELLIIEINTLPGLTPATVLYHQALAEKSPMFPRELLENLIKNKGY